ncbi:MAG: hypothetical protein LQ345_000231 [Seirophora villosa]|nr:MAG: hypothetical protein LQ345_000231 [Seirophora villosa]
MDIYAFRNVMKIREHYPIMLLEAKNVSTATFLHRSPIAWTTTYLIFAVTRCPRPSDQNRGVEMLATGETQPKVPYGYSTPHFYQALDGRIKRGGEGEKNNIFPWRSRRSIWCDGVSRP